MYGAIKNGIPVLTPDWLKKSLAANRLLGMVLADGEYLRISNH